MRNAIGCAKVKAERSLTHRIKGVKQRGSHEMSGAGRQSVSPFADDLDDDALAVDDLNRDLIVQIERQPE